VLKEDIGNTLEIGVVHRIIKLADEAAQQIEKKSQKKARAQ